MPSLDEYYRRWEIKAALAAAAADADDGAARAATAPAGSLAGVGSGAAPGSLGVVRDWANLRPEDIGVHIGRPLTEAEFAVHRAAGARVVTRAADADAAARSPKK